jgi:hypothetical protein
LSTAQAERRIEDAKDWRSLAVLDASVRELAAHEGRGDAEARLSNLLDDPQRLQPTSWFARPLEDGQAVLLRGAVLLRARGPAAEPPDQAALAPDLQAALRAPASRPAARLRDAVVSTGPVSAAAMLALGLLVLLAGALVVAETAVLRGAGDPSTVVRAIVSGWASRARWPSPRASCPGAFSAWAGDSSRACARCSRRTCRCFRTASCGRVRRPTWPDGRT